MPDRRLYAQLTLDYADSHKIAPLSDAAFRAHVSMILWSRRMMTDGRIPAPMALVLARKPKVLAELTSNDPVQPSLIRDENGDYWLHDFLEHQPSRSAIEARQETNRANGARGGRAKTKRVASESLTESLSETEANLYTETETETENPSHSVRGGRERLAPPVNNSGEKPAAFCPKHPTGTDQPCRACGNARRAHDTWTPPPAAPRPPRWDPLTHCEHGQLHGSCDACTYEAAHVAEILTGRWGTA